MTRRVPLVLAVIFSLMAAASLVRATDVPGRGTAGSDQSRDDYGISVPELAELRIAGIPRATADEPLRPTSSEPLATAFLDRAAVGWTRQNHCGTCHTNLPYLMARPRTPGGPDSRDLAEVRRGVLTFAQRVQAKPGNRKPFLLAPITAALLVSDGQAGRPVDPEVRDLLRYLWTLQNDDGGWSYGTWETLPFLERNPYYVSLLVALGIGYAPPAYAADPATVAGMPKLIGYLRRNKQPTLHERAVLLWASARVPALLDPKERHRIEAALRQRQNRDGGWALAALGSWPRHDGAPSDPKVSDGYATGLVALALCSQGRDIRDPRIARAMAWIDRNQRQSGRWFTRSTYSDGLENDLSNMATAYAVMATGRCSPAAATLH